MAGANFQYDETGSTFYYFLVSFYALLLVPFTVWVFRSRSTKDDREKDKSVCHCEPCQAKHRRLGASKPKQKLLQTILYVVLIAAWILLFWAAYQVAQIKTDDHIEYDPYIVLEVDRGASDSEIRKAYRELSRRFHPDKNNGDETMFMRIAKAYAALTDAESRKNWEEYGNPDGPGAMQFGIALPKWLVEGNTSAWVLMSYVVVFMVILPAVVGTWWYKSIKYSGDKILLPTSQLFFYFINKTPNMIFKRAFMILAASFEFWKRHNLEIVERPTDDSEVLQLIRSLSPSMLFNEKNKEQPLCLPYSIKARALLLAHMQRLALPADTLQQDLYYVLAKCPILINEMVQICAQLVAMSRQGQALKPRLDTVENIMKLSPLLVQGLWETSSPLLMLPHISEQHLKYFVNKKRSVRNLRQFCQLPNEEKRSLMKHLEDREFRNMMTVLQSMPCVSMKCDLKVLDDEDSSITANSIVTVKVTLTRESMLEIFGSKEWTSEPEDAIALVGSGEVETTPEESHQDEEAKKKPQKVWEKQKKKGKQVKKKSAAIPYNVKMKGTAKDEKTVANGGLLKETSENDAVIAKDSNSVGAKDGDSEDEHATDNEDGDQEEQPLQTSHEETQSSVAADDWDELGEGVPKPSILEATSMISQTVHSPFFPVEKQEYWWLYIADKKHSDLITIPVRVTSLKTEEVIDVKFPAPRKPGTYTYTMCLKSDSYVDMDLYQPLKFDVKEAVVVENHPQWDISDEEEEKEADKDNKSGSDDDSEYEYDDD